MTKCKLHVIVWVKSALLFNPSPRLKLNLPFFNKNDSYIVVSEYERFPVILSHSHLLYVIVVLYEIKCKSGTSQLNLLTFSNFLFCTLESLSWSVKQPTGVNRGSPATLEWTISLSTEEKLKADRFSLIILEREMFLYSNLWRIMAVKQFSSGVHQEIGNDDTFDVIPGNDMTLKLKNITDTDATRFRCTFLSSFAAPKSIIEVEIEGEILPRSEICAQNTIKGLLYLLL